MMSPLLWQTIPFTDQDAWLDFLGTHQDWHRQMSRITATSFNLYDDLKNTLDQHGQDHDNLADALSLPRAGDLTSFDLNDPTSFAGWMWIHALDSERLRQKAGLV